MGMAFAEIFNQLKELEKKFNEIKYPPEDAFQPSFSNKIRKTDQDSLQTQLDVFELEELFKQIENR
jgi:hypothetical protein